MADFFYTLTFAGMALLIVVSTCMVLLVRNVLHSAVALFFSLIGVAALYVLLGADFLAAIQLLIYAGGVLVLIIFGVFLTTRTYSAKVELTGRRFSRFLGILLATAVFALLSVGIYVTNWPKGQQPTFEPTVATLGDLFLSKYLLPFEVISILLLFALIGSVILVKKELPEGDAK